MSRWLPLLLAPLLTPGLVGAQDAIIKDFGPQNAEQFITGVLNSQVLAKKNTATGVVFSTPQGQFDVEVRGGAKRCVVFRYRYGPGRKATLEQLNKWNNQDDNYLRAYSDGGQLVLTGTVDLGAGVSTKQLKSFYDGIQQERQAFEKFTAPGQQPGQEAGRLPGGGRVNGGDVTRQGFPAQAGLENSKTSWEVRWDFVPSVNGKVHLLRVLSADFKFRDKAGQWKTVRVARNLQLSEAFSTYDDGITAFLDLAKSGADLTVQLKPQLAQCVLPGETVNYSRNPALTVLREVHDDGLRWVSGYAKAPGQNRGYRGEKLALIAGFQAVNYVYLTEFDFTDDGRIVCRLGFTAHNYFPRGKSNSKLVKNGDVHLHVGCWRMDFDLSEVTNPDQPLGGPASNDYRILSRRWDPRARRFVQEDRPFAGGQEGTEEWIAREFTTLRVQSNVVKNSHQRPIAYELIAARFGSTRDVLPTGSAKDENMEFINSDYWITHAANAAPGQPPYHKVPDLAKNHRPLLGNPATVWYSSPGLHASRTEDFGGPDGDRNGDGLALTSWLEFTLRPRDLCDGTPLYSAPGK